MIGVECFLIPLNQFLQEILWILNLHGILVGVQHIEWYRVQFAECFYQTDSSGIRLEKVTIIGDLLSRLCPLQCVGFGRRYVVR